MTLELPDLPYAYEALEPVISAATLRTHHGKHHRAYVDKVNTLVSDTDLAGAALEVIVAESARRVISDPAMTALFNNAAQAWNHAFYWRSLRPKSGTGPQGALAELIKSTFGDEGHFSEGLKAAATGHFGSGWAWLVLDAGALNAGQRAGLNVGRRSVWLSCAPHCPTRCHRASSSAVLSSYDPIDAHRGGGSRSR